MSERLSVWLKRSVVTLVIGLPISAALVFVSFEASSQPRFCGSCHVMTPYYESWRHSTHADVACVECHIPPGINSTLRKKYEALSMVASYFTGKYGTNPWAEVDDQSCLRSGCHSKRLLLGTELFHGVLFDHRPHLTELRRGKRLRCTSCHSQIVQGTHMTVTASTCFLCHLRGVELNRGTGRCTLCHAVPERVIETAGLSFDHGEVKRLGMQCEACHEGVVRGEGEVPRDRCYTCHNDPERLKRYGDGELLHQTHVTEHKVECLDCHVEIVHAVPPREQGLATGCEACHTAASGHSAVRDLYRGIGGKQVEPMPAAMYLAGVRCEACHIRTEGDERRADAVSCMSCHGPTYLTMYRSWMAGLRERLGAVEKELETVSAAAEAGDGAHAPALAGVNANVALLRRGAGVHNPPYALSILQKTASDLGALRAEITGEEGKSPPWREAAYKIECLRCHFGVELIGAPAFGRDFSHVPHVLEAGLRCTICHGDQQSHGSLRLTPESCDGCHEKIRRPMAGLEAEECLGCHVADIGRVSEAVRFPHQSHIEMGFSCDTCHEGVDKAPHLEFARSAGARPALGHAFCSTCHADNVPNKDGDIPDKANCNQCHEDF